MADIKPDEDLRAYIDVKNIDCMNQNNEHPISSILRPSGKLQDAYLESSEDAQMIIDVSFNSAISLRKLKVYTSPEAETQAPSQIFIFANLPESMKDFTELNDVVKQPPSKLKFWGRELTEEEVNGRLIDLSSVFRWFRNVHSIQIFVESNRSGDEYSATRIDEIEFKGTINDAPKNLAGLKQDDDE